MLARDKLKGLVTSGFREINNIMILLVTISGRESIPTDLKMCTQVFLLGISLIVGIVKFEDQKP